MFETTNVKNKTEIVANQNSFWVERE
jgi:hypothetical protein